MKSQLGNKAKVFCWKKWRTARVIPLPDKPSSVGLVVEVPNIFKFIQQETRGYTWEFLLGVWPPVLKILRQFQTQKCHFPEPFSDRTSKIFTSFSDLAFWQKLCHRKYLDESANKKFHKCSSNSHIFSSFIEAISTFIHSRKSLENHTRHKTKIGPLCLVWKRQTASTEKTCLEDKIVMPWCLYPRILKFELQCFYT